MSELDSLRKLVQRPTLGAFGKEALKWHVQQRPSGTILTAIIEENRLLDFEAGLSVQGCPSFYNGRGRPRLPIPATLSKDTASSKKVFYCSYGPQNYSSAYSKVTVPRPSKGKGSRRSKKEAGESIKRGCLAQYAVSYLVLDEKLVKLSYRSLDHVNADGKPCHGSADQTALPRHVGAAWLSDAIRAWVAMQYRIGHSARRIRQLHQAIVAEKLAKGMPVERDDKMTPQDIQNILRSVIAACAADTSTGPSGC